MGNIIFIAITNHFLSADSVEFDDLMAGYTASKATQGLRRQVVPWRDSS